MRELRFNSNKGFSDQRKRIKLWMEEKIMIYVFLANGLEEIEALTPVDVLRRGGVEVKTVGVGGTAVTGSHGIKITADIADSDLKDMSGADGVVLPGGMPGTLNLEKNKTVIDAVKYCAENNKLIGAICAAPSVLGHLGLLEGKKAVCYPSFESELKGYIPTDDYVCTDGNIVTAKGMGVSVEFGLALLAQLMGEDTANKVKASIQCR